MVQVANTSYHSLISVQYSRAWLSLSLENTTCLLKSHDRTSVPSRVFCCESVYLGKQEFSRVIFWDPLINRLLRRRTIWTLMGYSRGSLSRCQAFFTLAHQDWEYWHSFWAQIMACCLSLDGHHWGFAKGPVHVSPLSSEMGTTLLTWERIY